MWIMCVALLIGISILLITQWIQNRAPVQTGPAVVVSRRAEPAKYAARRSGWNYLVTFRLCDGDTLELFVSEAEYSRLSEGLQGQLTWQSDTIRSFLPE